MFVSMTILAATPEQSLLEYGLLGAIVIVLTGFAYKVVQILLKDRDKAIADRDALLQDVFTKVIPAINRNTEVMQDRQDIDRNLIESFRESNKQLAVNATAFDEVRVLLKYGQNHGRTGGS